MPKVLLSNAESFYLILCTKEESDYLYGEDRILEDGVEVSDELLARALAVRAEWRAVQKELSAIKREHDKKDF